MVTLHLDEVDCPEDDQSPEIVCPDTPNVSLIEVADILYKCTLAFTMCDIGPSAKCFRIVRKSWKIRMAATAPSKLLKVKFCHCMQ